MNLSDAEVDQLREALDSVGHTVLCTYWRDEYLCHEDFHHDLILRAKALLNKEADK